MRWRRRELLASAASRSARSASCEAEPASTRPTAAAAAAVAPARPRGWHAFTAQQGREAVAAPLAENPTIAFPALGSEAAPAASRPRSPSLPYRNLIPARPPPEARPQPITAPAAAAAGSASVAGNAMVGSDHQARVLGDLGTHFAWAPPDLLAEVLAVVDGDEEAAAVWLHSMSGDTGAAAPAGRPCEVHQGPSSSEEDEDVYLKYRGQALRVSRARARHVRSAISAFSMGDHHRARQLAKLALKERHLAEQLHGEAAQKILQARNTSRAGGGWELDLHGLHAQEAVQALRQRLAQLEGDLVPSTSALSGGSHPVPQPAVGTHSLLSDGTAGLPVVTINTRLSNELIVITGVGQHSRGGASLPSVVSNYLIENKFVITLDMGLLVAGTKYRGEFEERLKKLMEEIKQADDIILVIDEVHTLIGAGAAEGAIDAANILKPALARGELQCIGATTLDEYRKHIEKDPALERRFQPVQVPEPSVDETIQILKGLRERYEIHHKLRYTDEALIAAAQLSYQYISDRFLPDKAIDLIDEAGSRVRLRHAQLPEEARELDKELRTITKEKNEAVRGQDFEKAGELRDREMELKAQISAITEKGKEKMKAETESGETGPLVTESDIQQIVSAWTGIPVEKVSTDESDRLLKMEGTLHQRVIGQDEAVKAISRAIRRARVGLKNPNRPIASFIFSGPTGVGKSELAKALASYYFGSEEAMVRLDMSEFMERHTVSKLIGSPPGYVGYSEGGQLTEAVRRRPYTVVLFDEIEKAHPDVFNMMLQILEDGRLTDSKGRTVDFKNTLLIMTSNVGSSVIEKGGGGIGFQLDYGEKDSSYNRIKSLVNEELKQYFRPEFLNRLDEIIVFRQLTKMEVKEIADIMLKEVFERLHKKEIDLQVTERFRDRVVDEGYSPSYGARPLRRAIMRLLEDSMAERMLSGEIKEGDSAIIDVDADGNVTVLNGNTGTNTSTLIEAPAGIS
eukprot:SM000092S24518  [mRNA]  locus=s92:411058:422286:+ [translate_table: standard]